MARAPRRSLTSRALRGYGPGTPSFAQEYGRAAPARQQWCAQKRCSSLARVWLEHDRQTDRASQALHIHPNTLLYRVRRFEQISGHSLTSTASLAEVWLALRATAAVPEAAHRPAQP